MGGWGGGPGLGAGDPPLAGRARWPGGIVGGRLRGHAPAAVLPGGGPLMRHQTVIEQPTGSAAPQCGAISQATAAPHPAERPGRDLDAALPVGQPEGQPIRRGARRHDQRRRTSRYTPAQRCPCGARHRPMINRHRLFGQTDAVAVKQASTVCRSSIARSASSCCAKWNQPRATPCGTCSALKPRRSSKGPRPIAGASPTTYPS